MCKLYTIENMIKLSDEEHSSGIAGLEVYMILVQIGTVSGGIEVS